MKTKQVADRLGKHENTVRNYAKDFGDFLSPAPAKGEHRTYTDNDLRILGHIARLSDAGMKQEEIHQALLRKFEEGSPFSPIPLTPSTSTDLITVPEMEARIAAKDAELQMANARLEELRKQIENLVDRQDQERKYYLERITGLSQEIEELKAQLKRLTSNKD